jgi:tetratricopeptide (TPR) repeat protein
MLARQEPPGDPDLRERLARALAAGGSADEARAMIEAMVAEDPQDLEAIAMLAEFDPARALALLEQGFAGMEDRAEMRVAMLDILIGTGNAAAAVEVLERFEREGQPIDPNEWGMVAEAWLSEGDETRGITAMQRALSHEHGDPDAWVHRLEELAPEALLRELERRIASDEARNDEYWGSLADSYWSFGRHADARAAWERAYELDADDNEWPARLEALREGRDPFGG